MRPLNINCALRIAFCACALLPLAAAAQAFDAKEWAPRQRQRAPSARFSVERWFERRQERFAEAERLRGIYAKCVDALRTPAEDVTVPVENYDDGSVKTSIYARKAQFFVDDALVWGDGVVVTHYSEKGDEVVRLTAQSCVVDRKSKCGWAQGHAKLTYGGTTVEGDGVYFSIEEEYVIIADKSSIATTDLKLGGLKL